MTIPPACHHEIINGIELLLAARLRWAPVQPEDIERTATAWLVAAAAAPVRWDDARDPARIRLAFARLAGTALEWPPPAGMLNALPPVRAPLALDKGRAPPSPAARQKMAEIRRTVKSLARNNRLVNANTGGSK